MRLNELFESKEIIVEKLAASDKPGPDLHWPDPVWHGVARPLSPEYNAAIPRAKVVPQLRNTDTYLQYRYGVAMAAAMAPEHEFDQESVWGENIGIIAYSPAEEEIIRRADKLMGVASEEISQGESMERADTIIQSPISGSNVKNGKIGAKKKKK